MNRIIYQIAQMQLGKGVPIFFFTVIKAVETVFEVWSSIPEDHDP